MCRGSMEPRPRRPIGDVIAIGALTGVLAGFAAGLCDAIWSWGPAAQFVPGVLARLRFVLYTGLSLAAAGVVIGVLAAAGWVVMTRFTRLGDLLTFGWAEHEARRAKDPREAVIGLSFVLAGVPLVATAIEVVQRIMTPVVVKSHAMGLAVSAVIAATLVALGVAVGLTFVVGRAVEVGLRALAPRVPIIASPWAPLVAFGVLASGVLALWAYWEWEIVRVLGLRGPLVVSVAAVLASPASVPARRLVDL